MNVSQLAVYQLPAEIHTMRKRNIVPFYNRRRALNSRDMFTDTDVSIDRSSSSDIHDAYSMDKWTHDTTTSCSRSTVTSTVTLANCTVSRTVEPLQSTTHSGPPLACLLTPEPSTSSIDLSPLKLNRACRNPSASVPRPEQQPQDVYTPAPVPDVNTISKRDDAAAQWNRVAYYTSTAPAQATGLSFLANVGDPQKSGTFD